MNLTIDNLAKDRLNGQPYPALKRVTCEFHDGLLILRGSLPTYYLKQVAQTAVAELDGIQQIENQIEVRPLHSLP